VVGYGPFSLCVIEKKGLCPSNEVINMLMMIIMKVEGTIWSHKAQNRIIWKSSEEAYVKEQAGKVKKFLSIKSIFIFW
jgi:hypothetical protein